jgi:ceramide glucosyltransferase
VDWEVVGLVILLIKVLGDAVATWAAAITGVFSLLFALVSIVAAYKFFRLRLLPPPAAEPLPPVTILKPLKGLDRELADSLRSFCRLDYPGVQILFTVASPEDPALECVEALKEEFPGLDMEVVVSKNRIGFNPKINNLANAAPLIKHELLLMSDSDIKVRPDFLRRAVAHMGDPRVGLVTAFYQATSPRGFWARLEALSVNANFLPQAVTSAAFGLRFAMGAAILVRRGIFERVGGFALMADHLADDFVLGKAVKDAGYRLEIAEAVVESTPDLVDGREHFRHQARWARTIRLCQPDGYLGTVMLHGFSLSTLSLVLFGFNARLAALAAGIWAAKAAAKQSLSLMTGGRQSPLSCLLIPFSEWVAFGAWLSGFRASRVLWRGELYDVESQGRLIPVAPRALEIRPAAAAER